LTQGALVAYVERAAEPLDKARKAWLALCLQSRLLKAVLSRRASRIAALASLQAVVAFGLALYFPVLLFALGPVLFGVAHVAADVRYLVLRQELAGWWRHVVWLGCAALLAVRTSTALGVSMDATTLETLLAAAFLATASVAGRARGGSTSRTALSLSATVAAATAALLHPDGARLVFLHAHNLIAVGLWLYLFAARRRSAALPLFLIAAFAGLLASGALYRTTLASPGASAFHLHVFTISDWIAPFARADLAVGLVSAFVFLQSMHYGVWLSSVPQETLKTQGTTTFRMSVRSWFSDFGVPGGLAIAVAAVAVLLGGVFELHRTRELYLSLAMFHGYLELALLAYFFVLRGGPRCKP
jgi:hypothetical protein